METTSPLTEAIRDISTGTRNPEEMKKAAERLDRAREETKKRVGVVDVAVEFVREARECN